jgi:internalin A
MVSKLLKRKISRVYRKAITQILNKNKKYIIHRSKVKRLKRTRKLQIGGGIESATKAYINYRIKNPNVPANNVSNVPANNVSNVPANNVSNAPANENKIYGKEFLKILAKIRYAINQLYPEDTLNLNSIGKLKPHLELLLNKIIDWIINSHINANTNFKITKANITTFLRMYDDFILLTSEDLKKISQSLQEKVISINNLLGLDNLGKFLTSEPVQQIITPIKKAKEEKLRQKEEASARQREYKRKGESGGEEINLGITDLEFKIYKILTEDGAKYYGAKTKWCTAGDKDNMFDYYNKLGDIFIIIFRGIKFQIHFATLSFKSALDEDVSLIEIIAQLEKSDRDKFINFILEEFKKIRTLTLSDNDILGELIKNKDFIGLSFNNLEELSIHYIKYGFDIIEFLLTFKLNLKILRVPDLDLSSHNLIQNLKNLKILDLYGYKQPLGDALNSLRELEELCLNNFNYVLGTSLEGLKKLKKLDLHKYNQPLGDALNGLSELEELLLYNFNSDLGTSLKNLTKLKILNLYSYNQPLGDALRSLVNLEKLYLNDFNSDLGTSLEGLKNLKILDLYKYNQLLGDALISLSELEELYLIDFNSDLGTSLENLTKLKILDLFEYNQPLGNELRGLRELEELYLNEFDYVLGTSLENLTKLKILKLYSYKQSLGDALRSLSKLEELYLNDFNSDLGTSLENLTKLKILDLFEYNQPLGNELRGLRELEELYLNEFDYVLGTSLENLTKLKILKLYSYKQSLGDALISLSELEELYLIDFNSDLGTSLENLTKLKILDLFEYNQPLGNELRGLSNLEYVKINQKNLQLDEIKLLTDTSYEA